MEGPSVQQQKHNTASSLDFKGTEKLDVLCLLCLKDASFHIPIYLPHRKYLRFAFWGVSYKYSVLPFSLYLSPRVFVQCTEAALREQDICLSTYLDDWLLLVQSKQESMTQMDILIKYLVNVHVAFDYCG